MPHKSNITYWIKDATKGDICDHFLWLVNLLREFNISIPRMIIFFRQIKQISEIYEYLISCLGHEAYVDYKPNGPNDDRNRLFDMFHLTDCCDICMKSCRCNCKCSTDECNCESSNYCNKVEPPLISAILTTEPENTNSDSSGSSTDAESPEIDSESSETDIEVQSRKPQIIYYSSDSD